MAEEGALQTAPATGGGPIRNIALSLSGGGVRAVGFHLGLLEMMDRLDLLEKVTILSTVSGGSLTGTGYALAQHFGHSFDRFFGEFYAFFPELNTIESLLAGLASDEVPSPSGRRDMITLLANLYDDVYFKRFYPDAVDDPGGDGEDASPRFGLFWNESQGHLREMIFNATEFQTGTAFRFQKSDFRSLIGNENIFLCEHHARKIRMADIMAASSCIPVGMEPMFFPDDFHWPDDEGAGPGATRPTCDDIKRHLRANLSEKFRLYRHSEVDFFALMDGGVYDNQGIVSMLLAMNRLKTKIPSDPPEHCVCGKSLYADRPEPGPDAWARWLAGQVEPETEEEFAYLEDVGWKDVDLLIVSDTPVRKDSLYPKLAEATHPHDPEHQVNVIPDQGAIRERKGLLHRLTLGGIETAMAALGFLLLTSGGLSLYKEFLSPTTPMRDFGGMVDEIFLVLVPFVLTLVIGIGLVVFRRKMVDLSDKLYAVLPKSRWSGKKPWSYLKKVRVMDVVDMVGLRIKSTSALTASIYMNRIRSLSYSALYSRKDLDHHIMTNQIFALEAARGGKPEDWPRDFPDRIRPLSEDASALVTLSAHMATKLWINRVDKGIPGYAALCKGDDPLNVATRRVIAMNEKRKANGHPDLTDLDVLVIAGQLTGCYKLMVHLWTQRRDDRGWHHPEIEATFEKAVGFWHRFADDPADLLNERKLSAHEALHPHDLEVD